jgi:hypothetical protein
MQVNGLVFNSSEELCDQLDKLLSGFWATGGRSMLETLGQGVKGISRWEENWEANAAPVLAVPPTRSLFRLLLVALLGLVLALGIPVHMSRWFEGGKA